MFSFLNFCEKRSVKRMAWDIDDVISSTKTWIIRSCNSYITNYHKWLEWEEITQWKKVAKIALWPLFLNRSLHSFYSINAIHDIFSITNSISSHQCFLNTVVLPYGHYYVVTAIFTIVTAFTVAYRSDGIHNIYTVNFCTFVNFEKLENEKLGNENIF